MNAKIDIDIFYFYILFFSLKWKQNQIISNGLHRILTGTFHTNNNFCILLISRGGNELARSSLNSSQAGSSKTRAS